MHVAFLSVLTLRNSFQKLHVKSKRRFETIPSFKVFQKTKQTKNILVYPLKKARSESEAAGLRLTRLQARSRTDVHTQRPGRRGRGVGGGGGGGGSERYQRSTPVTKQTDLHLCKMCTLVTTTSLRDSLGLPFPLSLRGLLASALCTFSNSNRSLLSPAPQWLELAAVCSAVNGWGIEALVNSPPLPWRRWQPDTMIQR